MKYLKSKISLAAFLLTCFYSAVALAQPSKGLLVEIADLDPKVSSSLGNEEVLYVLVRYDSDEPLRFQALALRGGVPLDVGALRNPGALHAPGKGEALAWVGYRNQTHIDAVRVTVLDEEWQQLYQLTAKADVKWQGVSVEKPRMPAEWVESLARSERRKKDFVYDPSPQKNETLFDVLFFLTIASIPLYLLLQLHMLWRYQYRWRELSMIPVFPYLIVAFYYLAGLDIETSLLVTFLFRYTPFALLYLACLWLAKRFWQHKLPPPKLYKPPKSS